MKTSQHFLTAKGSSFRVGIKLIITLGVLFFTSQLAFTQSGDISPIIFKQIERLAKSPTDIDVYAYIARCHGSNFNQIFLRVNNEVNIDQDAIFTLQVTNTETGDSFTRNYNIHLPENHEVMAFCNSGDEVKIDLPDSYKPHKVSMEVTF